MRGVTTWARRRAQARRPRRADGARRPIAVQTFPLESVDQAPPRLPPAGDPRRRRARRVAGDRPARARDLGQRPASRGGTGDLERRLGRARSWSRSCSRSVCSSSCRSALTSLIKHQLGSSLLFWAVEGVLRTSIFLGYLWLLSRMRDLRRVFEYHGAEHKAISCYEAEDELTPERAALYSRLHPRCGTSFLLIVMIMAIFVFAPIGLPAWWILVHHADRRRAADRRPVVRGDQVGRAQPPAPLGPGDHVAGAAAAAADHPRARPRPARGGDRRAAGRARASRSPAMSRRGPVGVEVVA